MDTASPTLFTHPAPASARDLLAAAGLPTADLTASHFEHFIACGTPGALRGLVGVELHGDAGLLRSLAVRTDARGQGCGERLVTAIEAHARAHGVRTLYLLTNTAETFFARRGYRSIPREEAPAAIRATHEFASLCPASAVCMSKTLVNPADPAVRI